MTLSSTSTWPLIRRVGLTLAVVAVGAISAYTATKFSAKSGAAAPSPAAAADEEKIRRISRTTIHVPDAVAQNIALQTAVAGPRTRPLPFPPLQGTLALDANRLARVHARFAGEVMTLGETDAVVEPSLSSQPSKKERRAFQVGDPVRKGDLLAVVWSKDLGEKKSELVDAVSKLRADELTYRRLDEAKEAALPERSLREAERNVEADRIAVQRAERTLRTWRLTEEEIAAVRREGEKTTAKGTDAKPEIGDWARVEVRSPQDGVILEKNVAAGDIVDTTNDLFKIGDVSRLVVWAHVYEEDLPLFQAMPKPIAWTVKLPSRPEAAFAGRLEKVREVVDSNQHTALVTGPVENPTGELKVGQFVTVVVELPAPKDEIELPTAAVVEDGRESVVFVKTKDGTFVRTPVRVSHRLRDSICVHAGGVRPGDAVVTNGSLLLNEAMAVLPAPDARTAMAP